MRIALDGIGLLAPGLEGWQASRAVLSGARSFEVGRVPSPAAAMLPPNERRRSSDIVRWAVQVAEEAMRQTSFDPRDVATVFASSDGDTDIFDRLCATLATTDRTVSPTLFHQSVHNAPAGYWAIAASSQASSTALSCYDDSFVGGLLEAMALVTLEQQPVLLVAYDMTTPGPLYEARPIPQGCAVAMLLSPHPTAASLAELTITLHEDPCRNLSTMADQRLDQLRLSNPAARSLPVLAAIASRDNRAVDLAYLDDQAMTIQVSCASP